MRLLLVSEGFRDVGRPAGNAETGHASRQGAVCVLTRRTLEERFGRSIRDHEIETGVLPRVHELSQGVRGYERKVEVAIIEASLRDCTSVAIVVDRDGPDNSRRFEQLNAGREKAREAGHSLADKTALGVAIETVEAWLLADTKALNTALELNPPASTTKAPETMYAGPVSRDTRRQTSRTSSGGRQKRPPKPTMRWPKRWIWISLRTAVRRGSRPSPTSCGNGASSSRPATLGSN